MKLTEFINIVLISFIMTVITYAISAVIVIIIDNLT